MDSIININKADTLVAENFKVDSSDDYNQTDTLRKCQTEIIIETQKSENKGNNENECDLCNCQLITSLLWPLTLLLILFYFRRQLKHILSNLSGQIKKIKIGAFELELQELAMKTESYERTFSDKGLKFKTYDFRDIATLHLELGHDIRTTFLSVSIEIERTLREIYERKYQEQSKRSFAVSIMIEKLREMKVLDMELVGLLRQFWIFRNNIVHAMKYEVTEKEFLSFTDTGIRILRILRTIEYYQRK